MGTIAMLGGRGDAIATSAERFAGLNADRFGMTGANFVVAANCRVAIGFSATADGFTNAVGVFANAIDGFANAFGGFISAFGGFSDAVGGLARGLGGFTNALGNFTNAFGGFAIEFSAAVGGVVSKFSAKVGGFSNGAGAVVGVDLESGGAFVAGANDRGDVVAIIVGALGVGPWGDGEAFGFSCRCAAITKLSAVAIVGGASTD